MKKSPFIMIAVFASIFCGCVTAQKMQSLPTEMQPEQIKSVMKKVADWQLANPSQHHTGDWTHGALFAGLTAWAQMADTDTYYEALLDFGEKNQWKPNRRIYHADDYVVAQMYIEMYKKYKDPKMIQPIQKNLDTILLNPPKSQMEMVHEGKQDRWNWCDALFMGPPVWAKMARLTGDNKYLDFMNQEWWATTDFLYDKDEHLYYRDSRYFDRREQNGEKIFWSRGNGWVFAGLTRVLEELPLDHPDKARYIQLYKEMASKLAQILPEEGLWHSSLLDPVNYPSVEASGSGFFCYGLAWGINKGLLDGGTYLPVVLKSWKALTDCVHPDGMLGYVQPIGADPRHVNADQTEIYGVGSFLLAGSEVYKIAVRKGQKVTQVIVTNPGLFFRDSETITVKGFANMAVFDLQTNKLLMTQTIDDQLLFQTDLAPGQKKSFWVMAQPDTLDKPKSKITTYCRFIPERKDDFGWENDKAAYRMYGPALEYETITSGIDAWGKCVPYPVIDKFIKAYTEKKIPYHDGHADTEGGDFYKVGNTLGCGGMAPFVDGKVCLPRNFVEWKVLANGPIRSTFELTYKPWKAGTHTVSEKKRISIDLGSNMNRIECLYSSDDTDTVTVAAGIVLRETSDQTWSADEAIAYWLPTDFITSMFGCGVVFDDTYKTKLVKADGHLLLTLSQKVNKPVVYYAGSCWNKNEEFSSFEKWQAYLKNFKACLDTPVSVKLKEIK